MHKYFGTDGLRGLVGRDLTDDFVGRLAGAVASFAMKNSPPPGEANGVVKVLIGRDTRPSGEWIENIFVNALQARDIEVVRVGVVPTTALSFLTREEGAGLGIMITASHNPVDWNGVKLFDSDGRKLKNDKVSAIEELLVTEVDLLFPIKNSPPPGGVAVRNTGGVVKRWLDFLVDEFADLRGMKTKIFVDCVNGSGAEVAREVFARLGLDAVLINTGNGEDINKQTEGTLAKKLIVLDPLVTPAIGFEFDGDADRCIVHAREGKIQGDRLIAALAVWMRERRIVGTILFNSGVEKWLHRKGVDLVRVPVGDKYVCEALERESLHLGGEESGHIIVPSLLSSGDGLMSALLILRMMKDTGKGIVDLTRDIPLSPSASRNFNATPEMKAFLRTPEFSEFLKELNHHNPKTRIVIRPSGTEDFVRILVEG